MPEGAALIGVENTYQLSKSMPKARCAKCGRAIHWSGWTGLLSSGDCVLLGKKCGGDAFGSWDDATAELEAKRSRQFSLRRLKTLQENRLAILAMLPPWQVAARTADQLRGQIEVSTPELFAALSAAVQIGSLNAHRRIQVRNVGRSGMKTSVKWQEESFGPFVGARWFACGRASLKPEMVVTALDEVHRVLSGDTNLLASKELKAVRDRVDAALAAMQLLLEGLSSLQATFERRGVDQLGRWSAADARPEIGRITQVANGFAASGATFILPVDYQVPSAGLLGALEYARFDVANDD